MPSAPAAARIADTLRAILARGLDLTPEALRFIDSTFSQPSAAELAAILIDDSAPERDSLLELLFELDETLQIELEDRLSLPSAEPLSSEAVVTCLASAPARPVACGPHRWHELLVALGEAPSKIAAVRLLRQRAVKIDGTLVTDGTQDLVVADGRAHIISVGPRRHLKIVGDKGL